MPTSVGRDESTQWSTVALLEAWKGIYPSPSYIRDQFFGKRQVTSAKAVACDYWFQKMRLAPWVSPISRGRVVLRDKMKTSLFEPAKLEPVRPTHPWEMWERVPGESIGSVDPQMREAELIAQDMLDLDAMVARSEEKMCCDCLTTGSVISYSLEPNGAIPLAQVDYEKQPNVIVTPPWTDPTSLPMTDLKSAIKALSAVAGAQADTIIFGDLAASLFEENESVKLGYDKLWIRQGILAPEEREWGITTLGSWRGINLTAYSSQFISDLTGDMTPYLAENLVIVGSKAAGVGSMAYGGVWMRSGEGNGDILQCYSGERIWSTYWDGDTKYLRCTARPIPVPPPSQNWLVLQIA